MGTFLYSQASDSVFKEVKHRLTSSKGPGRNTTQVEQDYNNKAVYAKMHAINPDISSETLSELANKNYSELKKTLNLGAVIVESDEKEPSQAYGPPDPSKRWEALYEKSSSVRHNFIIDTIGLPTNRTFSELYNPADRLVPKHPAITEVLVDNQARLGSVRTLKVSFTVFSRSQLEYYTRLYLSIRKFVAVEWGYTNYEGSDRDLHRDIFIGGVYNFKYTVLPDGGFTCVTHLIQPGATVLNSAISRPDLTLTTLDRSATTSVQERQYKQLNIFRIIEDTVKSGVNTMINSASFSESPLPAFKNLRFEPASKAIEYYQPGERRAKGFNPGDSGNYGTLPTSFYVYEESLKNSPVQKKENQVTHLLKGRQTVLRGGKKKLSNIQYGYSYISFSNLLNVINGRLLSGTSRIIFDGSMRSKIYLDTILISTDPSKAMIPYSMTTVERINAREVNSDKTVDTMRELLTEEELTEFKGIFPKNFDLEEDLESLVLGKDLQRDFRLGYLIHWNTDTVEYDYDTISLSNIQFELRYLQEIFDKVSMSTPDDDKDLIGSVLSSIFDTLSYVTGGTLHLGIQQDPDDVDIVRIVDTRVTEPLNSDVNTLQELNIPAITEDSIVRSILLETQVTGRIASSVYAETLGSPVTKERDLANKLLTGQTSTVKIDKNVITTTYNSALSDFRNIMIPLVELQYYPDFSSKEKIQHITTEAYELYNTRQRDYYLVNIDKYRDILEGTLPLFPLNLKVELDGLAAGGPNTKGLKFGNVITTNWLPKHYYSIDRKPMIHFITTRLSHRIVPNEWTLTIETVARILTTRFYRDEDLDFKTQIASPVPETPVERTKPSTVKLSNYLPNSSTGVSSIQDYSEDIKARNEMLLLINREQQRYVKQVGELFGG